jgi:hypothetical protein
LEDWKQHKQICKLLNKGHGGMPLRTDSHISRSIEMKEQFERNERIVPEDVKRFFRLFQESTKGGSPAAAREMKKIRKRHAKHNQKSLIFHSLRVLIRSDSKMLSWPNSPLLVTLQLINPSVLCGDEDRPLEEGGTRYTPLHDLADLVDPVDYSTHESQLILAKQLIVHGANVNGLSIPQGETPLHEACTWGNVTQPRLC